MNIKRHFWPVRTGITFFDLWSIVHFCTFVGLGATIQALDFPLWSTLLALFVLGIGWEFTERFTPIHKFVKFPESLLNSWVSDPIVDMVGGVVGIWLVHLMNG